MTVAKTLRYVAFGLMALFGLLGSAFVIGETFMDPGGWPAFWVSCLWVVPMLGLSVFALRRPEKAGRVLPVVTAVVLVLVIVDALFGVVPRDDWGPVAAVAVFALGVALGCLGLHRPGQAGLLMVVVAVVMLVAVIGNVVMHQTGALPPGPGLGGSSGAVVMPLLVVGVMFLVAAALAHEPVQPRSSQPSHPAR